MNVNLYLDGSRLSYYLLKKILSDNIFTIKLIIASPSFDKKKIKILKQKFKVKISNLKKIKKNILKNFECDIFFSYYDYKIPIEIINKSNFGGINFHPSYLPYNKGRHSTFWSIINNTPFGATSHWISKNFDEGDIFFQEKLKFNNFENAFQIYNKQLKLLEKIITKTISYIKKKKFKRLKQKKIRNEYHFAKDINKKINICIYDRITSYDLSNLIRATTFNKKTGLYIHKYQKIFFVKSEYKIKKIKYKKNYYLNLKDIFFTCKKNANFKFKLHYKTFELLVKSQITKVIKK